MQEFEQIEQAKQYVCSRCNLRPRIGVILGSGLGAFGEHLSQPTSISYADIPNFPTSSVIGHAGKLMLGTVADVPVVVMSGRVHYYEGYDCKQVAFPVRVAAALGVERLLITNAAGALNPTFAPGELMRIDDHLNLTGVNPLRGPNDERLGPRFVDMSAAYDREGAQVLARCAAQEGLTLHSGTYAGVAGPSYETPAEVHMLRHLGGDAVGMSTVAEVIAARHAQLRVAALSVITNRAAGLADAPLSHAEVKAVGARLRAPLCALLERAVEQWSR